MYCVFELLTVSNKSQDLLKIVEVQIFKKMVRRYNGSKELTYFLESHRLLICIETMLLIDKYNYVPLILT